MRKAVLFALLVSFVALLSPFLGDALTVGWLTLGVFDLTGNYFWLAIVPVELVAVGVTTLLLMKVYKHRPRLYLPLYLAVSLLAHSLWLNNLSNPIADIFAYLVGVLFACAVWFTLLQRYYLRR